MSIARRRRRSLPHGLEKKYDGKKGIAKAKHIEMLITKLRDTFHGQAVHTIHIVIQRFQEEVF